MATAPLTIPDETQKSDDYTSVVNENEETPDPVVYIPPPAPNVPVQNNSIANAGSYASMADVE